MKNKFGVTLMELLLVVALMAVVAPVTYPVAVNMMDNTNDQPVINMVRNAISYANSMGIIGRSVESKLSFKTGDEFFLKGDGDEVKLPKRYSIGKITKVEKEEEEEEEGITVDTLAKVKFKLNGKIEVDDSSVEKLVVAINRDGKEIDKVEVAVRLIAETPTTAGGSGSGSGFSSTTKCSFL